MDGQPRRRRSVSEPEAFGLERVVSRPAAITSAATASARTGGTAVALLVVLGFLLTGCAGEAESRVGDADELLTADVEPEIEPGEAEVGANGVEDARPASSPVPLSPGTSLMLTVGEELSTSSHVAGDGFVLTVREDLRSEDGSVRIPRGTQARGVVTESRESRDADQPAVLIVSVRSVRLNGEWVSIDSRVEAVDVKADSGDSNTRTAAKVATGTAAGAMVGRILGKDRRGTLTGAAVGTAAGTAVAVRTRSGHATIAEGSLLVARLNAPLVAEW